MLSNILKCYTNYPDMHIIIFPFCFHILINQHNHIFRQNGLSPTIINKLVHGQNVNTSTLEYFCKLLNCDIGDIMEYVPDETSTEKESKM